LLGQHTPAEARIVAFDRDPRHGEAYAGTPLAAKIERRVGVVSKEAFSTDAPGCYDLIFLDADHTYEAVKHDTQVLLPFLAPAGMFVWHDYANWGKFSGKNGVPEWLQELSARIPVAAVSGSWLAAHSPSWVSGTGAERFQKAMARAGEDDPWTTSQPRG
jgi:hypothetical protein